MPRRRGTTRGGRGNPRGDRGGAQGRSTPYPAITPPGPRVTRSGRSRTITTDAAVAISAITPDPVSSQQSSGRIADYSLEDFMQLIRDVVREERAEPQNQRADGTASVAQNQSEGPPPPPPPISGQGALE